MADKVAEFNIISKSSHDRHTFCDDHTVATYTSGNPGVIKLYDMHGNEIHSGQGHHCSLLLGGNWHQLCEVTLDSEKYLVISCSKTREMWLYNFSTCSTRLVSKGKLPDVRNGYGGICLGPNNTILACKKSSSIYEFTFTENRLRLTQIITRQKGLSHISSIYCVKSEQGPLLFTSYALEHTLIARHLHSGRIVWEVNGEVDGIMWEPLGSCYGKGRLYVADAQERVIVLEADTGSFIQSILPPQKGQVCGVGWSNEQPHLAVMQVCNNDLRVVTYFNIHDV